MPLSYQDLQGGGDGPVVAAGIAGGLSGVADAYREQRAERLRVLLARISAGEKVQSANIRAGASTSNAETRAGSNERIAAGRNETAITTTGMKGDTARDVQGMRNQGAEDVANIHETGRNERWQTPSANTQLRVDFGYDKAALDNATRRYGIDTHSADSRYGTNVRAGTARRGQDLNFELGTGRNNLLRTRDQNNLALGTERNEIANRRANALSYDFLGNQPTAGRTPVTPLGAPPAPQGPSDQDIDKAARDALTGLGKPLTPNNIQTFIKNNREKLIQQIQGGSTGGGAEE